MNTAVAESFRQFADEIEAAENKDAAIAKVIKDTFKAHRRILFDGNGYSEEWEKEAERRGLRNLKTSVDAYEAFMEQKNVDLFSSFGVMTETEMRSREEILFENYSKIINIEALTMIVMASRDYIPAVERYMGEIADAAAKKMSVCKEIPCSVEKDLICRLSELNETAYAKVKELKDAETEAAETTDVKARAKCYCQRVLPLMEQLRVAVDEMETLTASCHWPVPTYGDMMFRV